MARTVNVYDPIQPGKAAVINSSSDWGLRSRFGS